MSKTVAFFLLIVLSIAISWFYFGDILLHPNDYFFQAGGDGVKNYFTPLYFIENDSGVWFTGMNYPFGEHVVFTDNQPVLSWTLQWVDQNLFDISGNIVGIMNSLMLMSLFLSIGVLFFLQKRFGLPTIYALVTSLIIGFLAP